MSSPAFIAGPLVPTAVRGQWYDGIFSVTDWSATLLSLAGVANVAEAMGTRPGHEATPVPPLDGRPMSAALTTLDQPNASSSPGFLGRDEWYIAAGRCVTACNGNSASSTTSSSKGEYQIGSGSKYASTRALSFSGG